MANLGTFNPDAVEDQERELLPPGQYVAQIIESDLVSPKSGNGQMLKLTLEIIEGPCARRKLWENLNIVHTNADAQAIAQRSLKRICAAVGHQGVLTDSEALHFKPMRIRVGVREDKTGQYGPQNNISGYDALTSAGAPRSQASGPPQQQAGYQPPQQQAAAGGGRPWR